MSPGAARSGAVLLVLVGLAGCGGEPVPATADNRNGGGGSTSPGGEVSPSAEAREADEPEEPPAVAAGSLEAPDDVAAPPADAQRSASGLAWRVIRPGTGTRHPSPTARVTVHYTGWRAETGEMFDSSIARGEPATFPLDRVISGWTEGVQHMVEGEWTRFWIPADLAYGGRAHGPQGMLVFDVELISIEPDVE